MDDIVSQPDDLAIGDEVGQVPGPTALRRLLRGLGLVLLILAVLLTVYGAVAYTAWQRGQTLRVQNAQQALEEQIATQVALAGEDITNGNFALAMRRLDWVLEREVGHVEAQRLHSEAQSGLNARLTPTPRPTATPTAEAVETPQSGAVPQIEAALAELERLMDEESWESAVTAISAFQHEYPDERRQETDGMLYNAYINLGVGLLSGSQIELGLFYLSQAEKLGDLPVEVEDQQLWAKLYLSGIGYYGVDWETTIFYFRGLCAAAPFYQDACRKFYAALVAYGDQFAAAQDWCPATSWYAEAVRIDNTVAAVEKRREAAANCLEATPTPEAPITGTVPITDTIPTVPSEESPEP